MFAAMSLAPAYTVAAMGVFLALQYFFVNKSNIALGAVLPGFWVAPLLEHAVDAEVKSVVIAKGKIKAWLVMLHECGLVAPPLVNNKESFTVRLRLRTSLFEKMASGRHSSSLRIDTQA